MNVTEELESRRPRRWLRFSLRTLLLLTTGVCVYLGWLVSSARDQRLAVQAIEDQRGDVYYDFELDEEAELIDDAQPPGPAWLRERIDRHLIDNVAYVSFEYVGIQDVSSLTKLRKLRKLDLDTAKIRDLRPLAGLTRLEWLFLANTPIHDISPLAELHDLRTLVLRNTQVSDLSALRELTELRQLYLQDSQVEDLKPLAGLTELEFLILDRTRVKDLSPLKDLNKLGWLSLVNTHVSDITPLKGLTALFSVELDQTNVSAADAQMLRQVLPKCKVEWSGDKPSDRRTMPSDESELPMELSLPERAAAQIDVVSPARVAIPAGVQAEQTRSGPSDFEPTVTVPSVPRRVPEPADLPSELTQPSESAER